MDINQHKMTSAFDQRDVLTSLRPGGAFSFPSSQSQGSNSGIMSSQSSSSAQATRSQAGSAFGGSMLPNFNSQQARLTPPLNSSSAGGGAGNSFMQSLLFQQPPPSSSPNRMFRQPMSTTSVPVTSSSVTTGSSSNLNSVMNPTAAMVASLQQQQQQQQQQRLAFGQALFGSGSSSSANTNMSQSSSAGGQPSMVRRPPTGGSSLLMDPSEFPVLASTSSGQSVPSSSQSGSSSSRLLPTASGSGSSGNSLGSAFSGFTQAQSAAAAAVLANRFANAGVPNAAAFATSLLAGFHQQQQQQQHYTNQLAMAAAAAAMASQSQNNSEGSGMSQAPQPAFRMDEDDFPALKPASTTPASSQNAQNSAGLIGSGNTSRSGTSADNLTGGNNDSAISGSSLSAFTTVEQSLNRANALGSGRNSTQPQGSGNGTGGMQHSQSSSGLITGISSTPSSGSGITVDSDGSVSNIPIGLVADAFGLVGLLSFMKTAPSATLDPASSAIAVGLALTELGLRLNAPEPLHTSFASPWHDAAGSRPHDMDCPVPPEYLVSQQQQQIAAMRDQASGASLGGFGNRALQHQQQLQLMPSAALRTSHEDLLFYLFYTCPGDALQLAAAAELCRRNWRYHRRLEMWLTRVDGLSQQAQEFETGIFEVFDYRNWKRERREQRVDYKDVDPTELFQFIQQQQMASQSNVGASANASAPPVPPAVSTGGGTGSGGLLSRNAF